MNRHFAYNFWGEEHLKIPEQQKLTESQQDWVGARIDFEK